MEFISIKEELNYVTKRNKIVEEMEKKVKDLGFIRVETDYFEHYDDYAEVNNRIAKDKLVKTIDNTGNILVLRPDNTFNLIKQVIPRIKEGNIFEFYYYNDVFKMSSSGLVDANKQFGIEIIGDKRIKSDLKIIELVTNLFKMFGLNLHIEVGNNKFIMMLVALLDLDAIKEKEFKEILYTKNNIMLNEFLQAVDDKNLALFLKDIFKYQSNLELMTKRIDELKLSKGLLEPINTLKEVMKNTKNDNIQLDLSTISSLDYYNGIVFRGYIENLEKAIVRGGRYDLITKTYDKETYALGFAINMGELFKQVIDNG
ncbi:MAG: ATP phosphoribosyltransferase regulatory subunit [Candidatus Izimaplasma sp.]|nr:ATP phosphoribosyltransferase regulatory subunit [Candidatus Izimaplasma bacterium]